MKRKAYFMLPDGSPFVATIELRKKDAPAPYRTVAGEPCGSFQELAITGHGPGSWGQTIDNLRKCKSPDAQRLADIWDRWHLNGMRTGSEAQNASIKAAKAAGLLPNPSHENIVGYLKDRGMYIDLSFSMPEGKSAGYEYGTAWLVEPLPASLAAELEGIVARNTKDKLATAEAVESRWQALIDRHDEDPVAAVREETDDIDHAESMFEEYRGEYSSFTDYAKSFAEDIGAINDDAKWPNNHIDWEAAASELERDYTVLHYGNRVYIFLSV